MMALLPALLSLVYYSSCAFYSQGECLVPRRNLIGNHILLWVYTEVNSLNRLLRQVGLASTPSVPLPHLLLRSDTTPL